MKIVKKKSSPLKNIILGVQKYAFYKSIVKKNVHVMFFFL